MPTVDYFVASNHCFNGNKSIPDNDPLTLYAFWIGYNFPPVFGIPTNPLELYHQQRQS